MSFGGTAYEQLTDSGQYLDIANGLLVRFQTPKIGKPHSSTSTSQNFLGLRGWVWICLTGGEFWASGGGWHQDSLGGCLLLLLLLLLLLEPLPGVHHLMTQDDTSLFLALLVELQIEIQVNRWMDSLGHGHGTIFIAMELYYIKREKAGIWQILTTGP